MADIEQEELQYEESTDVEIKDKSGADENMANGPEESIESELEAIKARVKEMEEEAEKIKQIQSEVDNQVMGSPPGGAASTKIMLSLEEKMEIDSRSIFVGNVDYNSTAEELEQHFHGCGAVNRVTILCNKYDGHPKGFAYVEFSDKDSIYLAMSLDDSLFRGRQLKVMPKRTNKPGVSTTNRMPRGMRRRPRFTNSSLSGGFGGFKRSSRPFRARKYYGPY